MPNKPPRNNQRNRAPRTVQSAGSILQRVIPVDSVHLSFNNQQINKTLSKLPESLRRHVTGVVEKADELVILTDSAAWAARLRIAIADLPELAGDRRTRVRLVPAGATNR